VAVKQHYLTTQSKNWLSVVAITCNHFHDHCGINVTDPLLRSLFRPSELKVNRGLLQNLLHHLMGDRSVRKQELSYRKQIAHQLRTQYAEGIYRPKYYTVTLKSRLRVTQGHWKWNHSIHDLLLVFFFPYACHEP